MALLGIAHLYFLIGVRERASSPSVWKYFTYKRGVRLTGWSHVLSAFTVHSRFAVGGYDYFVPTRRDTFVLR
jgi:hypothetical protein